MMRSTYSNNNNSPMDDEDDFAPNPFRGSSVGGNAAAAVNMDFFETPIAQQSPSAYNYTQQQQQQQPDPNTGMVGTLQPLYDNYHHQQQQQQQHQPINNDPSSYLTGTMDQLGVTNNHTNSKGGPTTPSSPPTGIAGIVYSLFNSCIQYDTVQALFDIDTIDIYIRIKASLTKFHHPNYFRLQVLGTKGTAGTEHDDPNVAMTPSSPGKGPDLYGPIWISMTCMFILGITANINDYYRHVQKQQHHQKASENAETIDEEFEYDLTHLLKAMYICFSYTFGISTFFWLVCICMGFNSGHNRYLSWTYWVCHYGYSLIPILFGTCVAWILPYTLYHWIVLGTATTMSGLFIVRNLSTPLLEQDNASMNIDSTINTAPGTSAHAKAAPILLSILGVHFTFLLVLKLTFYP